MKPLKETLNLPVTKFSMKANLAQKEPSLLDYWKDIDLYNLIQKKNEGKPSFNLHDGPPYANGPIHLGHTVNKILKDIIVKTKNFSGYSAPYVPGWDCHGLPIELNVEQKYGKANKDISTEEFRNKCRDYANQQIAIQKKDFIRLGVLGDWENPYKSMDYRFEANIVRSLSRIIEAGHLSRGFKPVYWCENCASALAEAEVEYLEKESKAIDLLFPIDAKLLQKVFNIKLSHHSYVATWTTTPWTLPGNKAMSVSSSFDYELIELNSSGQKINVVICSNLLEKTLERYEIKDFTSLGKVNGKDLIGLVCRHPFLDQQSLIIESSHVTDEIGTGFVHTAPAHGLEDYDACKGHDFDTSSLIQADGRFLKGTPFVGEKNIQEANEIVIDVLKSKNLLLSKNKYRHSFPHCWRHKTPLFFRATPQWFISMDQNGLLDDCLKKIEEINWLPEWGKSRIDSMMADRPDWCVSRQRHWGAPLPLFVDKISGELHPDSIKIIQAVADKIETNGVEGWFSSDPKEFLGKDVNKYEKITDILDVWFDSGVSHSCAPDQIKTPYSPADLYLEGSDQHRGWFQSSLITGLAMNSQSPYRTVLTHGFVVDADGRKMSKSLGNVISPQSVWNKKGADILRAWTASTDFRNEMSFSEESLERTADAYRRIRNTIRFLMGNLNDFDFQKDKISGDQYSELDKWIVLKTKDLQTEVIKDFENYDIHFAFQKILNFCTNELGGFYLDIIKDRLYTSKRDGSARRSAQSAMHQIYTSLLTLVAPILSFTAEESYLEKNGNGNSIFLSEWFSEWEEFDQKIDQGLWDQLILLKNEVNKEIEEKRNLNEIGSSLEAEVTLVCDDNSYMLLNDLKDELKFLFISSDVILNLKEKSNDNSSPPIGIKISKSSNEKCGRCWHYVENLNDYEEEKICSRCEENIDGSGEIRLFF